VTKQALSAWETGLWMPNVESLLKLVDATGCRIEVFFERTTSKEA
jgi:transcriptional regulator with XRE-family HTH domain